MSRATEGVACRISDVAEVVNRYPIACDLRKSEDELQERVTQE